MTDWRASGIQPADVLLPRAPGLGRFWPVVALDQYTSQPEVWRAAEREIGSHPSTLRLVVPEAFLEETEARSRQVREAMEDYLRQDLFSVLPGSFILVERETQSGKRVGLVLAVDLETYDYAPGSRSLSESRADARRAWSSSPATRQPLTRPPPIKRGMS